MPSVSSLEQLYDAHASALFHYFLGFVRAESDAKDLLQELFMKLALQPVPRVESSKAWVWKMAHNLAVDWLRRARSRQTAEDASVLDVSAWFQTGPDPDAAEFARHAQAALGSLPPEQQSVAFLKLWQGMTLDEIATAQGIPLNTAASRYRYALDKLRAALSPLYEEIKP